MCCGQKRSELRNSQGEGTTRNVNHSTFVNSHPQALRSQAMAPPAVRTDSVSRPAGTDLGSGPVHAPTSDALAQFSVGIRYLENSAIRARGSASGRYYEFSGSHPVRQVDARDASSLLNTRFFRRA
jgi:hypothetical protein